MLLSRRTRFTHTNAVKTKRWETFYMCGLYETRLSGSWIVQKLRFILWLYNFVVGRHPVEGWKQPWADRAGATTSRIRLSASKRSPSSPPHDPPRNCNVYPSCCILLRNCSICRLVCCVCLKVQASDDSSTGTSLWWAQEKLVDDIAI